MNGESIQLLKDTKSNVRYLRLERVSLFMILISIGIIPIIFLLILRGKLYNDDNNAANNPVLCFVEECYNETLLLSYGNNFKNFYGENYCIEYIPLTRHYCYVVGDSILLSSNDSYEQKSKYYYNISLILSIVCVLNFGVFLFLYKYISHLINKLELQIKTDNNQV